MGTEQPVILMPRIDQARWSTAMTKSLGPFDFGTADQRPAAIDGQRKRTLTSLAFDLFFPIVMVAAIYLVARNFFGF